MCQPPQGIPLVNYNYTNNSYSGANDDSKKKILGVFIIYYNLGIFMSNAVRGAIIFFFFETSFVSMCVIKHKLKVI